MHGRRAARDHPESGLKKGTRVVFRGTRISSRKAGNDFVAGTRPSAEAGVVAVGKCMSNRVLVPLSTSSGELLVSHTKPSKPRKITTGIAAP